MIHSIVNNINNNINYLGLISANTTTTATILYSGSLLATIIFLLLICVCNPKSKSKHKSFILSHDLTDNGTGHIASSQQQSTTNAAASTLVVVDNTNHTAVSITTNQHIHDDENISMVQNNKLKHSSLNRALPDIPHPSNTTIANQPSTSNPQQQQAIVHNDTDSLVYANHDDDNPNVVAIKVNQQSEDNVENHAYARIRNHHHHPLITDSSTENDTDDYSDPTTIVIVNNNAVASSINHANTNSQVLNQLDSNVVAGQGPSSVIMIESSSAIPATQPPIPPPPPPPPPPSSSSKHREISYNTISVREPLAKVLALERDNNANNNNLEHHYNEVEEEERISSFYEEINTSGSATYSKIQEPNYDQQPQSSTCSTSISAVPSYNRQSSNESNSNLPIYSFVDKKKSFKNNAANNASTNISTNNEHEQSSCVASTSPIPDVSNLYTKVVKPKNKQSSNNEQATNTTNTTSSLLQRYSPPPPLPPPLNHKDLHHNNRNSVIGYATPSTSFYSDHHHHGHGGHHSGHHHGHHRHHSSHYLPDNSSNQEDPRDPGYETVYKEIQDHHPPGAIGEDIGNQIDYGYEAISNDPAYEIVHSQCHNERNMDDGYETIKNNTTININHKPINGHIDNDDDDDEQSDPNYEIISNIKTIPATTTTTNTTTVTSGHLAPSTTTTTTTMMMMTSGNEIIVFNSYNASNTRNNNDNSTTNSTVNCDDNVVIIEHL